MVKLKQKPLKCRRYKCGAYCNAAMAEYWGGDPERCPDYKYAPALYEQATNNNIVKEIKMAKYINVEELERKIFEEQDRLKSDDDATWERNKPYFKGLAMAHALIRECDDVISLEKSKFTQEDS